MNWHRIKIKKAESDSTFRFQKFILAITSNQQVQHQGIS